MLNVIFNKAHDSPLHALFLGAHSDDIEIGCGGTILKLMDEFPHLELTWIVFGARGPREIEATASAEVLLAPVQKKSIILKSFRDGFFPYVGAEIKDYFEQIKREINPDLIFTHYRHDLHQDHRLICELTWNTFRDHLILEYEIPKYDGDLGAPNFFVNLDQQACEKKVDHLLTYFKSQLDKPWFTRDTFYSIMRLRGVESQASGKYAEAFHCRKIIFQ